MPSFFGRKPVEHPPCKAPSSRGPRKCTCCGREILYGLPEHDLFVCVGNLRHRVEALEVGKSHVNSWVDSLEGAIKLLQERVDELEATGKKSSPAGNKSKK